MRTLFMRLGSASARPAMARSQLIAICLTISLAASAALAEEQHGYVLGRVLIKRIRGRCPLLPQQRR
jgi:hypothetical protein